MWDDGAFRGGDLSSPPLPMDEKPLAPGRRSSPEVSCAAATTTSTIIAITDGEY